MEEKKNVFVYIRGVKGRGKEVINTLTQLGGIDYLDLSGESPNNLYYILPNGRIDCIEYFGFWSATWFKEHYTEIFLPKEENEFKPFQKVLVRDSSISTWSADLYSHYDKDGIIDEEDGSHKPTHICVGGYFNECIPFEGNEYLLGTTDDPKEK